ncbi:hypothetical protein [Ichthyobacterium seriolicida]|uniref:Cadherin-like beta sandwich domain-containing protein n=1 Tax=Ichthyobacterium seriolicida TaxID=242600 RepID=A0A1J1DZ09_9FLAO|nr:hypothetical protein [Ichthyobacterium seriolicida]BAV95137.1 hypothetical protein JBKA6_1124 [Ichthyobacterium seriolicida]
MKTNKIFKNTLSLLTLGLVVFSCSKPSEDPKTDQNSKALDLEVTSVKIEKAQNLNESKKTEVSEFYEKLFITKTPARDKKLAADEGSNGYPDKFEAKDGDIKGDTIFIKFPYNPNFVALSADMIIKTKVTFKSSVDVFLEDKNGNKLPIKGTEVELPVKVAARDLTKATLEAASTKQVFRFTKPGAIANDPISVKEYTVVLKFSDSKSDLCAIEPDAFGFKVGGTSNANLIASFRATKTTGDIVRAHYVAPNSNDKDGTETRPFEFELRKAKSTASTPTPTDTTDGELKTTGVEATAYFKADALKLPDGAFIEIGDTPYPATANSNIFACNSVNPITGNTKSITNGQNLKGNADASSKKSEYKFTVVAQDGTTKKYYKLTINADAPTGSN